MSFHLNDMFGIVIWYRRYGNRSCWWIMMNCRKHGKAAAKMTTMMMMMMILVANSSLAFLLPSTEDSFAFVISAFFHAKKTQDLEQNILEGVYTSCNIIDNFCWEVEGNIILNVCGPVFDRNSSSSQKGTTQFDKRNSSLDDPFLIGVAQVL